MLNSFIIPVSLVLYSEHYENQILHSFYENETAFDIHKWSTTDIPCKLLMYSSLSLLPTLDCQLERELNIVLMEEFS